MSIEKLKKIINENKSNCKDLVSHPKFEERLRWELVEIDVQDLSEYFLELIERKEKYENENNLLICVILGICDSVDLSKEPSTKMGEFPDVDVDYLPIVRDYLKNEWAPKTFGADKVCNIGNYGTFGLKSTLIDMARVHGLDRNEILNITTNLKMKDDEGELLTYESALRLYPELKDYCDRNPEVAIATQKLLHRNRSMGKHAGGLILCNQAIDKFVPLVKGSEGEAVSAWVEGLHGQDLGPVGLIKFDLLVVKSLWQICLTVKLVKERHSLKNICAAPNQWDWSDLSYLNDPTSLEMANSGDLRCVFQYDSDGIRKLVRKGGIESFDDLVAYVSLYRPSTLQMGMDETYCLRKRGRQEYEIPEILEGVLRKTYGVILYQEQIMQILSIVGKIPLRDCYQVIKAISKKKKEGFEKYKDKFIENGQITLGKSKEEVEKYFDLIESFAGYGFNLAHATSYSYISAKQLYLKAHYPLEFYAATLMCEQDDEKIREYITEAENHGVEVCNLDLNKSKDNFSIQENKIYVGFSNIKGIGEDKAKKIVEMHPYAGFEDFLARFGTEANVLRALIPLRTFKDAEPEILYKFWIAYSEHTKKCKDKQKRFEVSCKKIIEEASSIDSSISVDNKDIDISIISNIKLNDPLKADLLESCRKKLVKTRTRNVTTALQAPSMAEFKPEEYEVEDKEVLSLLRDKEKAQLAYFGFVWENELKNLPEYVQDRNFESFSIASEQGAKIGVVLVKVLAVNVKKFKNNKGQFVSLHVMDDSFGEGKITVWDDDYQRFKDEMKAGNYISIQITPPSGGFPSYTFYSPPRHERYKLPKDKSKDFRLLVLRKV
jgi:DNA polymerase III alpha subunit